MPIFRWFVGGRELDTRGTHMTVEHSEGDGGEGGGEGGVSSTTAFLRFIPMAEDNGKYLACRATNEYFPDRPQEDGHVLQVKCE